MINKYIKTFGQYNDVEIIVYKILSFILSYQDLKGQQQELLKCIL